ncbi:MAG: polyisoprenoid-binding protein [Gammaproteobacteria bacterium]|nr:polyisoprenoid-binding protein [Gammaproteobacteria bacterium]
MKNRRGLSRSILSIACLYFISSVHATTPPSAKPIAVKKAGQWSAVPAQSQLQFNFIQAGTSAQGVFKKHTADFVFSPTDLANARIDVTIDMASSNSGDSERDELLRSKDLFAVQQYPQSRFVAQGFEKIGVDQYRTQAQLTLRGVTKTLPYTFTLVMDPKQADQFQLKSTTTIKRLEFGVGQGDWKTTEWIPNDVVVLVNLRAKRN